MFIKICQLLVGLAFIILGVTNFWDLSINNHNWSNKEQFNVILFGIGEIVIGFFSLYCAFCF